MGFGDMGVIGIQVIGKKVTNPYLKNDFHKNPREIFKALLNL